jgi:hypothetical protein
MNNLPPEILKTIFIKLCFHERFICALVCRNWWNVLDRTCLLHSVNCSFNESKFIKFIDMIKNSPHRATQVQELLLRDCIPEEFDKQEICNMFPNARLINVADEGRDQAVPIFFHNVKMKHSKSTVQVLYDGMWCPLAMQILDSNMGERLKKLDLDFRTMTAWFQIAVPELKNMPVLEELTLKSFIAEVLDLEVLHENLPTIKSLELKDVLPSASKIPENIIPATITKLHYDSIEYNNEDALPTWYNYMGKKYTNVTQFEYKDDALRYIDLDTAEQMYENGFLPFLQLIGRSTDHHIFHKVPDGIDVFEALDNGGAKTTQFTFYDCQEETLFDFLAESNQARYVERMQLNRTEIGTLDSLQSLTLLTQIELIFDYEYERTEINFTSYLNEFPPSLEDCTVNCSCVFVDPETTRSSRIKNLRIYCEELTEALGDVLTNCFPNLVTLYVNADISEYVDVNIQSPDFKEAIFINPMYYSEGCVFSSTSASQTNAEEYLWHQGGIKRIENMGVQEEPYLTFTSTVETKIVVPFGSGSAIWIMKLDSNKLDYS